MPEEIEVPSEHLHETIEEEAHKAHGGDHAPGPRWIAQVALSSALIAVLAAVGALLAGHYANEAMLEQMRATDQWAYYQAKGIKSSVAQSKLDILQAFDKERNDKDEEKVKEYAREQKEIEEKGKELERESEHHMQQHSVLARSVTTFQIAIAMAAISVLTRIKKLWFVSLLLGAAGAFFLGQAFL
jgi:hypothetical protein